MSVHTSNKFGKIIISDEAVMMVANRAATECYGVVDLVSRRFTDSLSQLFNKIPNTKGIKVNCVENRIYIDVYAILKFGVNQEAVKLSLSETVRYSVEHFTGMRVMQVEVYVVGIRV